MINKFKEEIIEIADSVEDFYGSGKVSDAFDAIIMKAEEADIKIQKLQEEKSKLYKRLEKVTEERNRSIPREKYFEILKNSKEQGEKLKASIEKLTKENKEFKNILSETQIWAIEQKVSKIG